MEIPYTPLQYSQSNPLMEAAQAFHERRQRAAENLQKMGLEREKLALEQKHQQMLQAREDERLKTEKLGQVMPYLDPNSPTFNPAMAHTVATLHGLQLTQDQAAPPPMPQEPQRPAPYQPVEIPPKPEFVGPLDTPEHASFSERSRLLMGSQPVTPEGVQAGGDIAASEAINEQAKRDQYAQALAEAPKRVQQHAADMTHFEEQRDAYQQALKDRQAAMAEAQSHPTFHLGMPGQAPTTIDTRQIFRQTAGSRQERAQQAATAYADNPELAKAAGAMATMGFSDEQIAQAIEKRFSPASATERALAALAEKKNEFGAGLEEKKREADQTNATRLAAIAAKKKGGGAGGAGGASKQDIKEADAQNKQFRSYLMGSPRSPGALDMLGRIESVANSLDHAIATGDHTAATAAVEQAGSLMRGGVTTGISVQLLERLQSTMDELGAKWGQITGDPGYRDEFAKRIRTLMGTLHREQTHRIDDEKERYQNMQLKPGVGIAKTPDMKRRTMSNLELLSTVPMELGSTEKRYTATGKPAAAPNPLTTAAQGGMVTIRNAKTGETKQVTRDEAKRMGAIQ